MTLIDIVYLLGAGQGVFMALVLLSRKKYDLANIMLVILLLFFSFNLLELFFEDIKYYRSFPHMLYANASIGLLFGPLIYFYCAAVTGRMERFKLIDLLHFIPFFVHFLLQLPFYLQSGEIKIARYEQSLAHGITHNYLPLLTYILKLLQYLTYLLVSCFMVRHFIKKTSARKYRWLVWFLALNAGAIAVLLFLVLLHAMNLFTVTKGYTNISYFFAAAWIYAVTFLSMKQQHDEDKQSEEAILSYNEVLKVSATPELTETGVSASTQTPETAPDEEQLSDSNADALKYGKNRIPDDLLKMYKKQLDEYIEKEKPYHNSELTIGMLADVLNMQQNALSQLINSCYNANFQNYINSFRIDEAKMLLTTPSSDLNIIEVAYQVGFSSKSTFNTIFKKATGMTPTDYRRSYTQKK